MYTCCRTKFLTHSLTFVLKYKACVAIDNSTDGSLILIHKNESINPLMAIDNIKTSSIITKYYLSKLRDLYQYDLVCMMCMRAVAWCCEKSPRPTHASESLAVIYHVTLTHYSYVRKEG